MTTLKDTADYLGLTFNPLGAHPMSYDYEIMSLNDELVTAQIEARRYREALLDLYAVVAGLARPTALSNEMLRKYLKQSDGCKAAADALGLDRLDKLVF